ncbi:MAG: CIA30 family protein [Cyanobacteria bacterium P01_F01_bin.143]
MEPILVIGKLDHQIKNITQYLTQKNYSVTIFTPEKPKLDFSLPKLVNIIIGNINNFSSLQTQISEDTKYIIYFVSQLSQYAQEISQIAKLFAKNFISNTEKIIFDFTNPNLDLNDIWGAVDDVVMGGVSRSSIRLENHRAIFSGMVSTDNNGGFASVRTRNLAIPLNLSQYEGIELKVLGDGKRYKFITRCEGQWDGIAYCASFNTVCNASTIIRVRFCDLIPVFRAKTVSDAGAFDSSQVYAMQLMLSKFEYDGELNPTFEPGVFGLEVEYIKAYDMQEQPQLIIVNSESNSDNIEVQTIESILQKSSLPNHNYAIVNSHLLIEKLDNEKF